jgi:glycine/D-amino acid oxidase-like deaminating enzyme
VVTIAGSVNRLVRLEASIKAALLEDGQRVEGDRFLLATGATAGEVLRRSELGIAVQPLFYGVGVTLELRSPDHPHLKCIRTPNRAPGRGVYTVPYFVAPDGPRDHVLVGASSQIQATPSSQPRVASIEALTRAAVDQVNVGFSRAEVHRVNVGWRPTSLDTYPLVGPTSISNLVLATGTRRNGIHGWSRERAIARAVRHRLGGSAEELRTELERLHDRVGAQDWGIPPEMVEMYRQGHAPGGAR